MYISHMIASTSADAPKNAPRSGTLLLVTWTSACINRNTTNTQASSTKAARHGA